jgi:PAS domain S-box-containing protein
MTDPRDAIPEVLFRQLVESVSEYAIFALDETGHVMTWNPGAERLKGYKAEEILGQHFSRFHDEEEVRAGKCERELEIARTEGRYEEDGWRIRKDGSRFWANVVITALHAPGPAPGWFAKVTRDLTDRREAELERLRLARAQEAVRLRDEFLSLAAHELRTPLTGLNLQVQSLASIASLDPKAMTRVRRIEATCSRLQGLIDVMLDVSRIATGRLDLNPTHGDLLAAVQEVIDRLAEHAAEASCVVTLDKRVDRASGEWDMPRMEQVITNVLQNAFKYAAGKPVVLRVDATSAGVTIAVEDGGPGVRAEDAGRIFERFERAASERNYPGMGLGLYIAREIVRAHGGTIGVENRAEGGARFTIHLPAATVARLD